MDGVHCWPLISMPSTKDELNESYLISGIIPIHLLTAAVEIVLYMQLWYPCALPKCETKDSLKNSRIYAPKNRGKNRRARQAQQYRLAFLCVHVQCLWSGVTTGRQLLPVVEKSEKSTVNHILQYIVNTIYSDIIEILWETTGSSVVLIWYYAVSTWKSGLYQLTKSSNEHDDRGDHQISKQASNRSIHQRYGVRWRVTMKGMTRKSNFRLDSKQF
jgi:hypothetical protein